MAGGAGQRVVLLSCGSFNPPTIMHLRLFELGREHLEQAVPGSVVVGGVISPTHDRYKKASLIPATHRLEMARRAAAHSGWLTVSPWEAEQEEWTRTRQVLDTYARLAAATTPPSWLPSLGAPTLGPLSFKLLCGGDLLESFSVPGLWKEDDITTIVRDHGLVVISREGSDPRAFVAASPLLTRYQDNIHIVTETVPNDVSSTRVRAAVSRGQTVKYFVPDSVIEYIGQQGLYRGL